MKRIAFCIAIAVVFSLIGLSVHAQEILSPTCYRITLSDKENSPYSITRPSEYLSERALEKRARFNIAITEEDLPINPQYVQQIKNVDANIRELCNCRWFNTVTIYCPDSTKLAQIQALPFVTNILPVANYDLSYKSKPESLSREYSPFAFHEPKDTVVPYDYGNGYAQIALHNGHLLHNEGFRGEGMLIAVIDGGWDGLDTSNMLHNLFDEGRLIGTQDLLPWSNNVYSQHYHGTIVTTTMATELEGILVGSAPRASYYLIRSEETAQEQLIEEDFWAQAAVIADSIGADVVNSSLGYTTFADFPQGNYTYANMDGESSIASKAATLLSHKGVVVCVSAGNDGDNSWHYISHPADAYDILTVGAADYEGNITSFSSRGPSFDGRVKPDITSVGFNTMCIFPGDFLGPANGTSLACPVAAGLCACLWQALPAATSLEIMDYIRKNSSCYNNPNDSLGYGIPDFFAAYSQHVSNREHPSCTMEVYPNPCTDRLYISNGTLQISHVEIFNVNGELVRQMHTNGNFILQMDVRDLPKGLYLGNVWFQDGSRQVFKVVK